MCTLDTVGACSCLGRKKEIAIYAMAVLWGPKMPRKESEEGHVKQCWARILYRYKASCWARSFEVRKLHQISWATMQRLRHAKNLGNRSWRLNHVVIGSVDLYIWSISSDRKTWVFEPPKVAFWKGHPLILGKSILVKYYHLGRLYFQCRFTLPEISSSSLVDNEYATGFTIHCKPTICANYSSCLIPFFLT